VLLKVLLMFTETQVDSGPSQGMSVRI